MQFRKAHHANAYLQQDSCGCGRFELRRGSGPILDSGLACNAYARIAANLHARVAIQSNAREYADAYEREHA